MLAPAPSVGANVSVCHTVNTNFNHRSHRLPNLGATESFRELRRHCWGGPAAEMQNMWPKRLLVIRYEAASGDQRLMKPRWWPQQIDQQRCVQGPAPWIHLPVDPSRDRSAHAFSSLVKLASVSDRSFTLADQLPPWVWKGFLTD